MIPHKRLFMSLLFSVLMVFTCFGLELNTDETTSRRTVLTDTDGNIIRQFDTQNFSVTSGTAKVDVDSLSEEVTILFQNNTTLPVLFRNYSGMFQFKNSGGDWSNIAGAEGGVVGDHVTVYEGLVDTHLADNSIHIPVYDNLSTAGDLLWSSYFIKDYVDAQLGGTASPVDVTDGTTNVLSVSTLEFDADDFTVTDEATNHAKISFTGTAGSVNTDYTTFNNVTSYTLPSTDEAVLYVNDQQDLVFVRDDASEETITGGSTVGGSAYTTFQNLTTIPVTGDAVSALYTDASGLPSGQQELYYVRSDGAAEKISGGVSSAFGTITVNGQDDLVADGVDSIEFVGGEGVTITTDSGSIPQTVTVSSPGAANAFSQIAIDGYDNITAVGEDTLSLAAGAGMYVMSDPTTNTVTVSNAAAADGYITLNNRSDSPTSTLYTGKLYVEGTAQPNEFVQALIQSNTPENINVFEDSSQYNRTVTVSSNTDIFHSTDQAKFGEYSIRFQGANSYIHVDNIPNPGSSDFTVDGWFYITGTTDSTESAKLFYLPGDPQFELYTYDSYYVMARFYGNGGAINTQTASGHALTLNTWVHVAAVREDDTLSMYLNGVRIGTADVSGVTLNTTDLYLLYPFSANRNLIGFAEELRYTAGLAKWTGASFTIPNEPTGGDLPQSLKFLTESGQPETVHVGDMLSLPSIESHPSPSTTGEVQVYNYTTTDEIATVDSYTEFYLHSDSTNGDTVIEDESGNRTITQIPTDPPGVYHSSTVVKGGSTSFYFDNGNLSTSQFALGSQDFTIEGWWYITSQSSIFLIEEGGKGIPGEYTYSQIGYIPEWWLKLAWTGTGHLAYFGSRTSVNGGDGDVLVSTTEIPLNTWTHIAVSRTGSTITLFINGNTQDSGTFTTIATGDAPVILNHEFSGTEYLTQMYVDEVIVSVGIGRYTADFTPADTNTGSTFSIETTHEITLQYPDGTQSVLDTHTY